MRTLAFRAISTLLLAASACSPPPTAPAPTTTAPAATTITASTQFVPHPTPYNPPPLTTLPDSPAQSSPLIRPPVSFYGLKAEAIRIVYIIDHSGSTLDNFDFLREEVKRSAGDLTAAQSFNVIMVSEETHTVMPPGKLARATPESQKEFIAKIADFRAQGMNDDLLAPFQQAFEAAFKLKPDVIYFVTDAHLDPKLLKIIQTLNTRKSVQINTLAFISKDPAYEEQLQQIAKQNGGIYIFVSEKDLGR